MNIERFRQVLAQIEANPQDWRQESWCGSKCCLAGHAAHMSGNVADVFSNPTNVRAFKDKIEEVAKTAKLWLDITDSHANFLFSGDRTLEDFRRIAAGEEIPS